MPTAMWLDVLIGDRMAYYDVEASLWKNLGPLGDDHLGLRRGMVQVLTTNREDIEKLRAYWHEWWHKHREMSAAQIGMLTIERNLRLLRANSGDEHRLAAVFSLKLWTGGMYVSPPDDWDSWWAKHRVTYKGPIIKDK